jgi:predicted RNase H-like nuclease/ppGpp synthetase/RelA/SpoT-type nucleotidyltranferase
MYFVGVDLAWGQRKPTGLAALDDSGRLVHVSAVSTDEEIQSALAPYVEGDCLVAIDAPLIVTNTTGNRPAEAALNRDFARFDAGAHPSNTGKAEFSTTPRGARLSKTLGLDMDPESPSRRRAIEVYPHPATVSLFGLGRTLKYKNKSGRSLADLRSELRRLMELLEGLADAATPLRVTHHDGWHQLVAEVESAGRKSDLRRAEDQVDAVICAYVALYAERQPGATTTYGDFATGYIVTPTLPEGHQPSPRPPRTVEPVEAAAGPTRRAVQEYAARHPALEEAGEQFVALVTTILDDAGINYLSVTGRTKSIASFAEKATRTADGKLLYPDPLNDITDQLGIRVITYVQSDVTAVADLLDDQVAVLDDRDMGQETAREGRFGYASRHLVIALDPGRATASAYQPMHGVSASVQIRTVLQHAWAEFEHDIRYKGTIPDEHVRDFDRRFTLAAGLLELADREFSTIWDRLRPEKTDQRSEQADDDPRISARELAAFLAGQYSDAGWSRTDHYAWISGLLLELGITSLDELADTLRTVDAEAIAERMGYRYPPGAVRRLDDALLEAYGERYLQLHGNAHRVALLRTRLDRMGGTAG